jgi:hypothetical protein
MFPHFSKYGALNSGQPQCTSGLASLRRKNRFAFHVFRFTLGKTVRRSPSPVPRLPPEKTFHVSRFTFGKTTAAGNADKEFPEIRSGHQSPR